MTQKFQNIWKMLPLILCILLTPLPLTAQDQPADPNIQFFSNYLRQNWDDIHDVIMRFHNDNPWLQGTAIINMTWQNGSLISASVDSNDTGNPAFGKALIAALKNWQIPEIKNDWNIAIPFKTVIRGSNSPEFSQCGIFTGNVMDINGKPLYGAKVILSQNEVVDAKTDTAWTNREGIFICTLIKPGDWRIECQKDGYSSAVLEKLTIEKGKHTKKTITLEKQQQMVRFRANH